MSFVVSLWSECTFRGKTLRVFDMGYPDLSHVHFPFDDSLVLFTGFQMCDVE